MKKNLYKYAAMSVIIEVLAEKCKSLRYEAKSATEYYAENYDEIPDYGKADIDKPIAIADFIEDLLASCKNSLHRATKF